MAVVHSRPFFDRFQVDTTGTSFLPLKTYTLRPSSAFRFELVIEGFDGTQQATFRRVLTLKRGLSGPAQVVGRIWHCSETTKTNTAFDLRATMNPDGSFTLEAKNASPVRTTWKGTVERVVISR